ncbi:MAG: invasion associated locus B family protein [Fimbriimonadaceae bacterium]|nr:invasion associated locus B family protein [Alphaproteobacteria bacterium]
MTSNFVTFGKRAAVSLKMLMFGGVLLSGTASAQTNQPAEAAPDAVPQSAWVKLCNVDEGTNKEICVVSQELRSSDNGQLVASLSIRLVEGEKNILIAAVPTGVILPPGLRVNVDENPPASAQYTICFPNACVARMELKDEFIALMKKGKNIGIAVIDGSQQTIGFPMTLIGFTAAFDGPPTPQEAYAETQRNLVNAIQARAAQERAAQAAQQEQEGGNNENPPAPAPAPSE